MAKIKKVSMRKSAKTFASKSPSKADKFGAEGELTLLDHEDGSYTVLGVTLGGNEVDISGVATLEVVSDNESVISIHEITGMFVKTHAAGQGSCKLVNTATWNDGSIGPFVFDLPGTVTLGPAAGLKVKLDPPTPHVDPTPVP